MTKTISPPFRRGKSTVALARAGAPITNASAPRLFAAVLGVPFLLAGGCVGDLESRAPSRAESGLQPRAEFRVQSRAEARAPSRAESRARTPSDLACPRPPARDFEPGAVIRIEDRDTPCRIEFRKTGVRLEAAADGSRPGPGFTVVMDGRSRFYTTGAAGWRSVISVWDSEGKYLRSFGGEGEEPGKFRAIDALFVDGEDNLHVLDFAGWSVFSPNHKFLRRTLVKPPFSLHKEFGAVLDDGTILSSDRFVGPGGEAYFRVGDPDGTPRRAWAPASGGPDLGMGYRPISYVGGETFWGRSGRGRLEGVGIRPGGMGHGWRTEASGSP